jgi:tRNA A37 threonylcarbamoyladenosine modification protein TsaB
MLFLLSMLSDKALMGLYGDKDFTLVAHLEWEKNEELRDLGDALSEQFSELLKKAHITPQEISKIYVMQGPASFSGLRISAAFAKGLSFALNKPLVGIPTFRLFGQPFALSLRASKSKSLSIEECLEAKYKFLEVLGDNEFAVVEKPKVQKVLGLKDNPLWPNIEELSFALKNSQELKGFSITYGYAPEFIKKKS